MNLRKFQWILGGSFNIAKMLHVYVGDWIKYPQHFKAWLQTVPLILTGKYKYPERLL